MSLLKQSIAFIFILSFGAQTFTKSLIVFDYYSNTKAYAKNCENKAKPKMHCKGKCQMMKKLKQEEKKDEQNPERKSENKNEITLSSKSFYPALKYTNNHADNIYPVINYCKETKMPRALLRPPISDLLFI
ncbi:hypothetical protein ACQ33O_04780 [Ferruginibacter sp. SUN002]|uniref:hypothetical protein n=1 Tax=Ferruginibacter sp. SUN002 TaxID=2937789 RepID=UPI003D3619C1